jgi:4-hydroxyphenylpyruvate dioxygenase
MLDMSLATSVGARPAQGLAPELEAFDHLHWWVGNARHAAHFFASAFGFEIVGYAGPETGWRDRTSYLLRQGQVTFVVTNALDGDGEIADHVRRHGDGVRDIAYRVDDPAEAFERAVRRGARPVVGPGTAVHAFGDTVHSFVGEQGPLLPGFEPSDLVVPGAPVGLVDWDHVVTNVAQGDLDASVDWYGQVFGLEELQHFGEEDIATEYSALRSTVVWNRGRVVQPINEPAEGLRQSQIAEFLDYYETPGVQHVALRTDDIVTTVARLRERGVRFLRVPETYYEDARRRLADLDVELPWADLAELGILVDRDPGGHLLQVFTETVTGRPTAFLEVIQRCGARGFGEGNFKALFVSMEAEQARRGNL